MSWMHRLRSEDRGSVTAELVLVAPLLILFLLFVVALGRLAGGRIDVDGAAAQAARAASVAPDPGAAIAAAQESASSALNGDHVTCQDLAVATDTSQFHPGGSVAVTISCTVSLSDLVGLSLPPAETLTGHSVAVIDRFTGP